MERREGVCIYHFTCTRRWFIGISFKDIRTYICTCIHVRTYVHVYTYCQIKIYSHFMINLVGFTHCFHRLSGLPLASLESGQDLSEVDDPVVVLVKGVGYLLKFYLVHGQPCVP